MTRANYLISMLLMGIFAFSFAYYQDYRERNRVKNFNKSQAKVAKVAKVAKQDSALTILSPAQLRGFKQQSITENIRILTVDSIEYLYIFTSTGVCVLRHQNLKQ